MCSVLPTIINLYIITYCRFPVEFATKDFSEDFQELQDFEPLSFVSRFRAKATSDFVVQKL